VEVIAFVALAIEADRDKVALLATTAKPATFGYEASGGECEELDCFA
jgi:hypothetical protein